MDRASCSSGLKQTEARPAKSAALRRGRGSCEWRTGERRLRETCGGAHRRSGRTERPDFGARRTEEMAGLGLRTGGGTLVAEKGQGLGWGREGMTRGAHPSGVGSGKWAGGPRKRRKNGPEPLSYTASLPVL
jgi:hypothetical protein